jgi:hypothetical protein
MHGGCQEFPGGEHSPLCGAGKLPVLIFFVVMTLLLAIFSRLIEDRERGLV